MTFLKLNVTALVITIVFAGILTVWTEVQIPQYFGNKTNVFGLWLGLAVCSYMPIALCSLLVEMAWWFIREWQAKYNPPMVELIAAPLCFLGAVTYAGFSLDQHIKDYGYFLVICFALLTYTFVFALRVWGWYRFIRSKKETVSV